MWPGASFRVSGRPLPGSAHGWKRPVGLTKSVQSEYDYVMPSGCTGRDKAPNDANQR